MKDEEVRQTVIGCAYTVHNCLGAGFVEKVYENAMRVEIQRTGLRVRQQAPIQVMYDGEVVGEFAADLLVEENLIVELKAAAYLQKEHEIQLVNYLTATGFDTGLLINFGRSVEIRRKHREYRKPNPVHPEKSC
jgi:GxxExxY protein